MSTRSAQSRSSASPMQPAKETHLDAVRAKDTQPLKAALADASARANETPDEAVRLDRTQAAHADASELFDAALEAAGITSGEAAYLFGVSESVVNRMRATEARERVSLGQLLLLPPAFHWQLHKALNKRYGFARRALGEIVEALGVVALAVRE